MRIALCLLLAAAAWAQPHCALQGTVTDKASGEAIAGARIFLVPNSSGPHPSLLQRSDRQGAFCFETVEAGDYTLKAQRPGYLDETYGKGLILVIRPGAEPDPLSVKLVRSATLSGSVVDGDGEPVAGAEVAVYIRLKNDPADEDELESQQTDDRGFFRFGGLAPGTYYLSARLRNDPSREANMPFLDAGAKPREEGYQETFYSSAATFQNAKPLELQAGKDISGILLTLRKIQLRHIAGKVVGAPENSYLAIRYPNGDGSGFAIGSDGSFFRSGLEPGAYTLELRTGNQARGKKAIDLTGGDADGVVISADSAPPPLFSLSVQFHTEGPGPAYRPSPNTFTFLQRSDGEAGSAAQVKPDGTFQFTNLTQGIYTLVNFGWGTEEYYVKRILLGGQAVAGRTLDLRNGSPGDMQVVMGLKSAGIRGRIAGKRDLQQAVTILLVGDNNRVAARAATDQTGAFHMEHLASGKFRLYAVEDLERDEWTAELTAALQPKSLAIELADGQTKEVELPVIGAAEMARPVK